MDNMAFTLAATDTAAEAAAKKGSGPLDALANGLESVLQLYQDKLDALHIPYSYGWSIVLLTLTVKLLTFPLTKTQVESSLAVQNLKPRLDAIKARYEGDQERIRSETAILYEKANVNPLAGCLPTIATIPFFIGLYRSLSNAAEEGIFNDQGFYWIPSLAGPTTLAARQAGSGTAWLFPFVDGHPPIGWEGASRYLVLPAMVVGTQFLSARILRPPIDPESEQAKTTAQIVKFLPLMIGWFSLNVPSGLSLYYFSNTVLTMSQQIFLRKLGGADVDEVDLGPIKKVGSARRNGDPLSEESVKEYLQMPVLEFDGSAPDLSNGPQSTNGTALSSVPTESESDEPKIEMLQRRSKRKRKEQSPPAKVEEEKGQETITVTAGKVEDEFPSF